MKTLLAIILVISSSYTFATTSYLGITCADNYATGVKVEREYMVSIYSCIEINEETEIYETNALTSCHEGFEDGNYIQMAYQADRKECVRI